LQAYILLSEKKFAALFVLGKGGGKMKNKQAEMIAHDVLGSQSLAVDAVSGATLTSDTVKKAIEDALLQGIQ